MTIDKLLKDATLRVASQPPRQGSLSGDGPLTVPLIAEDYPAKTPAMWNEAYTHFGIAGQNVTMLAEPESAAKILEAFRSDHRYVGGGAGVGFKEAVVPLLDSVTPLAQACGAVNIVKKMPDGTLRGDNTDGSGYADSLGDMFRKQGKGFHGAHVLVLGAGGTARSIAFALAARGARLTILNRTKSKADELSESVNLFFKKTASESGGRERIPLVLPECDAVVSTVDDAHSPLDRYSPLGDMPPEASDEDIAKNLEQTRKLLGSVKRGLVVSDIRIRKEETPTLAQARLLGLPQLDGIPMVINQGAHAFWWLYEDALKGQAIADVSDVMWRAAH